MLAIDLFAGVGGMSLGFKRAGMNIALAVEHDKRHVDTYSNNFPDIRISPTDIRLLTGEIIFGGIKPNAVIDLVFGGPPCQGFSNIGGRDAIGHYRIGGVGDSILVDFALEAKCYSPDNAVRIEHTSRLISRLRRRQFGVLVTTSYVHHQAYKELKEDGHPVLIISGEDIARILATKGIDTPEGVHRWLSNLTA